MFSLDGLPDEAALGAEAFGYEVSSKAFAAIGGHQADNVGFYSGAIFAGFLALQLFFVVV
ncbi:hypothetical protein [Pseudomonas phoenicis]|uniref:hypothetical protein n=1 Tax=unclassified Pseudomonas TaxID=196821 RepID=UPI00399FA772